MSTLVMVRKEIFVLRWRWSRDLAAVAISWIFVTGMLFTATVIVGPDTGGGLPYFFLYAVLAATVMGVGFPLYWMVVIRKRPLSDLGISTRYLGISLVVQLALAGWQYFSGFNSLELPVFEQFIPLVALALAIGFFEALFWRGWVLLRLEAAFGILPAILIGSLLYALYHIGYAMPLSEVVFLFFIGIVFAVVFRLTRNIFILWPVFQPMGQVMTLVKDGLDLPLISSLGFIECLAVMIGLVWFFGRLYRKRYRNDS
jgi:uncharacterized protein